MRRRIGNIILHIVFAGLLRYEQIETYQVTIRRPLFTNHLIDFYEETFETFVLVNGEVIPEGQMYTKMSFWKAVKKTKKYIKYMKDTSDNIMVRIFPEYMSGAVYCRFVVIPRGWYGGYNG